MKKIVLIFFAVMSVLTLSAQVRYFKGSLKEAIESSKKSGLKVMVIASATWCAPCKKMAEKVFTDENLGYYMSRNFIVKKYTLDIEDPDNIAKTYNITAYPTMIFIDGDGKEITRMTGASDTPKDFQIKLEKILDPENSSEVWEKKIAKDPNMIFDYIKYLESVSLYKIGKKVLNDAVENLPLTVTVSKPWIEYFKTNLTDESSPAMKLFLERGDEVSAIMGEKEYDRFMLQKGVYFVRKYSCNKLFDRKYLENTMALVRKYPKMESVFLKFMENHIDARVEHDFETLYKDARKLIKKADCYSRAALVTIVCMTGLMYNDLDKNDERIIDILNLAIKYEKEDLRRNSFIKTRDNYSKGGKIENKWN